MEELTKSDVMSIFDLYHRGIEVPEIWNKVKDQWRLIQKYLPKGRLCPYCGRLITRKFDDHLSSHGKSKLNYLLFLFNLNEPPKCSNPNCNNHVYPVSKGIYEFTSYCSSTCKAKVISDERINSGLHNFQSKNISRNSDGKSIKNIKSNYTRIHNGTHNWLEKNLIRDEFGKSIHHSNIQSRITELGYNNLQYWNYDLIELLGITKEDVDQHNHDLYIHCHNAGLNLVKTMSHTGRIWESLIERYLGKLLDDLSIRRIPQYEVRTNTIRFIDQYLPDYNIGLECDGMFKYNNGILDEYYVRRKHEIQSYTGIVIKNIPSRLIEGINSTNLNKLLEIINSNDYPIMII